MPNLLFSLARFSCPEPPGLLQFWVLAQVSVGPIATRLQELKVVDGGCLEQERRLLRMVVINFAALVAAFFLLLPN